ncbi:deleted in malignant brain tumors 1 protein-like [Melanerpes formicivorus]|uniref:deleted in malignant brain tumors 1 protein-like n=1 Tax=Melanerpes formicivorus TaxID=211600 RepID=UPI00358FF8B3
MGVLGELQPSPTCSRSRTQPPPGGARSLRSFLLLAWLWGSATTAKSPEASLRLVEGPDRCAGRLEVLHNGTWGTVCDDSWGPPEGQVVCRQLGCGTLLSVAPGGRYGEGTGQIWLDEVNCTGEEETLSKCQSRPWGQHNCQHLEDASVECSDSSISKLGPLRLQGGPNRCAGRVEVLHSHQWGTVCDDGWDLAEAAVVCRQLGCGAPIWAAPGAYFGRGHDPIWLDELQCTGSEQSLFSCQAREWGHNNCVHGEDAGVVCSASGVSLLPELRLANGSSHCQGRVEVALEGTWAALCDQGWGLAEARVVCRQLGCGRALEAPRKSQFGQGTGKMWPESVSCLGTETSVSECQLQAWANDSCQQGTAAGVVCAAPLQGSQVRLVNSRSRCSGRVEILHRQQWGTVCSRGWDLLDATAVCRQLDCGWALAALGQAQFGSSSGAIWLEQVSCQGTEELLSSCPAQPWGITNCTHAEDAGVVCSDSIIPERVEVRLAAESPRCAGRVEVLHRGQWGSICAQGWDQQDAEVVCRQLGCGTALAALAVEQLGPSPPRVWLDNVGCQGTEGSLKKCWASPWGESSCSHGKVATVVCSGSQDSSLAPLRLVGGAGGCAGRVEVLHNGTWGTVCGASWDMAAAQVVCQQMGCGVAVAAPGRAHFGQGQGPIWLAEVRCNGSEAGLAQCRAQGWGHHSCSHQDDASVVCSGSGIADLGSLRVVNGSGHCSGRLEVLHAQRWGGLCRDGWGLEEALVACRQLGCGEPERRPPGATHFGAGSDLLWVGAVECSGTEAALWGCRLQLWGAGGCRAQEPAAVSCSEPTGSVPAISSKLRLLGGLGECSGRVEIFHDQQWGTICDDSWDLRDAAVVCRQLGCGLALSAPPAARFGLGAGPIWLDDVSCTGEEGDLLACRAKAWGSHNCNHGEDAGVVCAGNSSSGNLRLVDGPHGCAGRVEVAHEGQWGTVCDDGWDLRDARVVCRQLGCGAAEAAPGQARFGQGSGHIWLDDVGCTGGEDNLAQCPARPWGHSNCQHREDASVICSGLPDVTATNTSGLRLVQGPHRCAGRVEVAHEGQWGTVCDDGWDLLDALVVCRQLGCGSVEAAPGQARFGQGSGHIWLDDVGCTGGEDNLAQCPARPWGQTNCHHAEDASVICSGLPDSTATNSPGLRLVQGPHRCAGRVEVLYQQQWGTVCDDGWDLRDAAVVCRQLGCGSAAAAPHGAGFGQGSGIIWLDDVSCAGTESALSQCPAQPWGHSNCNHREDASVVCSGTVGTNGSRVRLVDGPHSCAGRVEVAHEGQWGTVCDDGWDLRDARVVCRQLGCGAAEAAPGQARFGQGSGHIWLDDVGCSGGEDNLAQCPARPWGHSNCQHREDASVICSGTTNTNSSSVRLVQGPHRCTGRVEVLHQQQWGTVCDDGWDLRDAAVVCRQLGCGAAITAPAGAAFGQGLGPIWLDKVACTGGEETLELCPAKPWGLHHCSHQEDASVVCSEVPSTEVPSTGLAQLRLAGGPNRCAGRVEVAHEGQWGTVCDDGWDLRDARVVCRQLGCGAAEAAPGQARFGQGSGHIWLDDVGCTGGEDNLAQCPARPWGHSNCQHREDASVICSADANVREPQLRLAQGPHRCAGRVEVLHQQQWGTVCDDGWDLKDAKVVCRQLGCGTAVATPGGAHFGQGLGPIWLDEVECSGQESSFGLCPHKGWGLHNCKHEEDAGVVCSGSTPLQLRLQGSSGPCTGLLEVLYNSSWQRVCSIGWSLLEAEVVCRQLGCGAAQAAAAGAQLSPGELQPLLQGLSCHGTESLLLECQQQDLGLGPCSQGQTAAVVCTEPKAAGAAAPCWLLSALLVLLMLLSGVLLWLSLRRCMAAAPAAGQWQLREQGAAARSLQPLGAIYIPSKAEGAPEEADSERTQLMQQEAAS